MVDYYHARQANLLFAKETTWGTAVSATKDMGLVQNWTPNPSMNWTRTHSLSTIEAQTLDSGRADLAGSIELLYQHGRIFELITGGTVTHDATSTPDIKHSYALSSTRAPFTVEESHAAIANIKHTWKGVVLNSLTMSLALDGYVRLRGDWIAKDVDSSGITANTAVISSLATLKDFVGTLSWGTAASEIAQTTVQNAEVTFNNVGGGDAKLYGLDQKLPYAAEWNQRLMDFKFTLGFSSNTMVADFLGASAGVLDTGAEITKKSLVLNITNGIAAASGLRQIYINLRNAAFTSISKPVVLGGYTMLDVTGYALTLNDFYTYDNITAGNW